MKKLFLFLAFISLVAITANAQCNHGKRKASTTSAISSNAEKVAFNDPTIVKRIDDKTGKVSFAKKMVDERTGEITYIDVQFDEVNGTFISITPSDYQKVNNNVSKNAKAGCTPSCKSGKKVKKSSKKHSCRPGCSSSCSHKG